VLSCPDDGLNQGRYISAEIAKSSRTERGGSRLGGKEQGRRRRSSGGSRPLVLWGGFNSDVSVKGKARGKRQTGKRFNRTSSTSCEEKLSIEPVRRGGDHAGGCHKRGTTGEGG